MSGYHAFLSFSAFSASYTACTVSKVGANVEITIAPQNKHFTSWSRLTEVKFVPNNSGAPVHTALGH